MYNTKKIGIIGYGGFAREVMCRLKKNSYDIFINEKFITNDIKNIVKPFENMDINKYKILICIGDSKIRNNIVNLLPANTEYFTYIDKDAKILDKKTIVIGKGSIITAGSILTTNITIGEFSHINLNTTLGHDIKINDYLTTSPGVHISGEINIGKNVYLATGCVLRNKINICDNVVIGMNSVVNKNITESGVYVGSPVIKIK